MQDLKQPQVLAWHSQAIPGMQPPAPLCQPNHTSPALVTLTDILQPPSQIPPPTAIRQRLPPHIFYVHFKPLEDHCSGEKSQLQPCSPHLDFVI